MEIRKEVTINGVQCDLWRHRDFDGWRYQVTARGESCRIEPICCNYKTQKEAIEVAIAMIGAAAAVPKAD